MLLPAPVAPPSSSSSSSSTRKPYSSTETPLLTDLHPSVIHRLARVGELNAATPRDLVKLRVSLAHERAKVLQVLGRHGEALKDFNDVLDSTPNTPTALLRRGASLQALGRFDDAAGDYEAARRMRPKDPRFQLNYMGLSENKPMVLCLAGEEEEEDVKIMGCDELEEEGPLKSS